MKSKCVIIITKKIKNEGKSIILNRVCHLLRYNVDQNISFWSERYVDIAALC